MLVWANYPGSPGRSSSHGLLGVVLFTAAEVEATVECHTFGCPPDFKRDAGHQDRIESAMSELMRADGTGLLFSVLRFKNRSSR